MTTQVLVDAHAGWDVEVVIQDLNELGVIMSERTQLVPKMTKEHFYIHSHRQIGSIKELKGA